MLSICCSITVSDYLTAQKGSRIHWIKKVKLYQVPKDNHHIIFKYGALFQRIEGLPVSSSTQVTASSSGVDFSQPTSLNYENHSTTRPLPFDSDHRFTHLPRGLVFRREKSMTHFKEDSQSGMEFAKRKSSIDSTDEDSNLESLEKSMKFKASEGLFYEQSSDNEDICPTCLDASTSIYGPVLVLVPDILYGQCNFKVCRSHHLWNEKKLLTTFAYLDSYAPLLESLSGRLGAFEALLTYRHVAMLHQFQIDNSLPNTDSEFTRLLIASLFAGQHEFYNRHVSPMQPEAHGCGNQLAETPHENVWGKRKNYDILKANIVAMSPAYANRLPHVYKDLDTYDPDRFGPGRDEAGAFSYISLVVVLVEDMVV
ncbi:hypothetical protein E3N88_17098 [Mikania micrantha]|uniref:Uncharacterized protein n=1 Tax=Mikania micrantha TaxID=192012 RepID=A0A5N6NQU9_9ASTR|nr:hypothetical protein E3N88_17098 [Mikania micrantha]